MGEVSAWRRVQVALAGLAAVVVVGTIGYASFGFGILDALYQTVTTVFTVGFQEVHPFSPGARVFTIFLIIGGVGVALYALGSMLELLIEGQLREIVGRRRMERDIHRLEGHTIICGWGRVGQTIARFSGGVGESVVIVDRDPDRLAECLHPSVLGDATDDEVLERAGITRAKAVVAAVADDAANLFIIVSARAINPDAFLVARARSERNESKMLRAGANRVVNPQQIGGARMAAFVHQPHVAEFLDVVMHDGSLEFRLAELLVTADSAIAGQTLRDTMLRQRTGALVLAIRTPAGEFVTNPPATTALEPGHVLIAVGTEAQLTELRAAAGGSPAS